MSKNDFIVNGQMPAFPSDSVHQFAPTGLTKREYFAAMAMQGLLSNANLHTHESFDLANTIKVSIQSADELLKQLES